MKTFQMSKIQEADGYEQKNMKLFVEPWNFVMSLETGLLVFLGQQKLG